MSTIARRANIERPTVYDVVADLSKKGILFISTKKGLKQVSAVSPKILIDRFKDSFQKAETILPDLINMAFSSPLKPRIKFYEGMQGFKDILKEFSYSDTDTHIFTDYKLMPDELQKYIWDEIVPERKRRNSRSHLIVPDSETNRIEKQKDIERYSEHRLIKFPLTQENPLELLLWEGRIGFLSYSKNEMFGLVLDSEAIYQTIKNIFLALWNSE